MNIDDEWTQFLSSGYDGLEEAIEIAQTNEEFDINMNKSNTQELFKGDAPEPTPIFISTKSKIAYLNQFINLFEMFWAIPILSYSAFEEGVIKKQIKINSVSADELDEINKQKQAFLEKCTNVHYEENVTSHINNPLGRIKFKDVRKISFGLSKKDITNQKTKKSKAFSYCFVLIVRMLIDGVFKEFNVKVFNVGKLEFLGVQSDNMSEKIMERVISILQKQQNPQLNPLNYSNDSSTVLINSNFNCGFYINREVLHNILKHKYNIQSTYDPCQYPGIQCTFYHNKKNKENKDNLNDNNIENNKDNLIENNKDNKDNTNKDNKEQSGVFTNIENSAIHVSILIFRTGSVIITGKCEEYVIYDTYEFIKQVLKQEFNFICQRLIKDGEKESKKHKKKPLRKTIHLHS